MRYLAVLLIFLNSLFGMAYNEKYKREAEIPEPLVFDLVRRVHSDKGELEVNTLLTQTDASHFKGVYMAPEVEYAFADGKAVEFELPSLHGKIKTIKTALQLALPDFFGDLTGAQIIHEKYTEHSINETTILLLSGKRLSDKWSAFTMWGNKFVYGNSKKIESTRWRELPIINLNLFYDYAEAFDIGLEYNLRGIGASFEELMVMPQIHALLAKDFKIQAGFGTTYDGYVFSPISAFRFIKEFNH